jgi:hypothetical protein
MKHKLIYSYGNDDSIKISHAPQRSESETFLIEINHDDGARNTLTLSHIFVNRKQLKEMARAINDYLTNDSREGSVTTTESL